MENSYNKYMTKTLVQNRPQPTRVFPLLLEQTHGTPLKQFNTLKLYTSHVNAIADTT